MKHLSSPLSVVLDITNRCNLNCKHCSIAPSFNSAEELSKKEWFSVIDDLTEAKVLQLLISGGEPLMRPDIFDILDYIDKKAIYLEGLNTNGTLITKEAAAKLASYKKLNHIQISIDGASPETHDKIRGVDTFNKMLEGAESLAEKKCRLGVFTTVNKYNSKDLEDIVKLSIKLGVRSVNFTPILKIGNACLHDKEIGLSRYELISLMEEIAFIKEKYGKIVSGTLPQMASDFNKKNALKDIKQQDLPVHIYSGCKATFNRCAIRHDGAVLPCDRLSETVAGYVTKTPFLEIWRDSTVFNDFRKRWETPIDKTFECKNCEYNVICSGGCPAVSFSSEGSLFGLDYLSCKRFLTDDIFYENFAKKHGN
jgi:mycofactocin biosynthetic radical S-adenosylmethionine protein MftC